MPIDIQTPAPIPSAAPSAPSEAELAAWFQAMPEDQLVNYITQHYPDYAWAFNIPDVRGVLLDAARHPDDPNVSGPEAVQSRIRATNWYRTTSETQRQFTQLYATDPATLTRKIEDKKQQITNAAAAAGIDISTFDLGALANDSLMFGWDDSQIRQSLVDRARYTQGQGGAYQPLTKSTGSIGQTIGQIQQLAAQYLMPFSEESAAQWATSIWDGRSTLEQLQGTFRQQALDAWGSRNPALADAIQRGIAPLDYLQPQISAVATTLQMGPQQIDLMDPKWSSILNYDDGTGNLRIMTVPESQLWARKQDQFRYTDQAKSAAHSNVNKMLETFGIKKF
jgi:hypothetical protein